MAGISNHGNHFVPDFWADTLMVNPAFGVYLKAKWGFIINNQLNTGYTYDRDENYQTKSRLTTNDFHMRDDLYPMFLFNFKKLTFGIGGDLSFGGSYKSTLDEVGSYSEFQEEKNALVRLGAELLFAVDITDSFKFGLDAKFNGDVTTLDLHGHLTPGILIFAGKHRLSFSLPLKYAYIEAAPLPNNFKFDLIFVDDIELSNKFSIRIPARAEFSIHSDINQFSISVPFSGGISLIGKPAEPLLAFFGADLEINPNSENIGQQETNNFRFQLAPALSAGIEGTVLPWFTLRAGMRANLLNYTLDYHEARKSYNHTLNIISGVNFTTGVTFKVWKAFRIDIAADLNNIESIFTSQEVVGVSKTDHGGFYSTLTVAFSLFSD